MVRPTPRSTSWPAAPATPSSSPRPRPCSPCGTARRSRRPQPRPRGPHRAAPDRPRCAWRSSEPIPTARVAGIDKLPGTSNYFIGNDPRKWRTNVPAFARVKYDNVYPGVDLVYYGNQRQLEYDFVLAPGADPGRIALGFTGADTVSVDAAATWCSRSPANSSGSESRSSTRRRAAASSPSAAPTRFGARARSASRSAPTIGARPLVIDPVLVYSTYLGGSGLTPASASPWTRTGMPS